MLPSAIFITGDGCRRLNNIETGLTIQFAPLSKMPKEYFAESDVFVISLTKRNIKKTPIIFNTTPTRAHFNQNENLDRYLFGNSSNKNPIQKINIDGILPPLSAGAKNPSKIIRKPKRLITLLSPLFLADSSYFP